MKPLIGILFVVAFSSLGCSSAAWTGIAEGLSENSSSEYQSHSNSRKYKCPVCDMKMRFMGEPKIEYDVGGPTMVCLYRCPKGHEYYFKPTSRDAKSWLSSLPSRSSSAKSPSLETNSADVGVIPSSPTRRPGSRECPTCNMSMYFTGETNTEWGKMRYLYRCPSGHEYYFSSTSISSDPTRSTGSSSSHSYTSGDCPVCGMMAVFTGETYTEWGRLHYVYKCASGHRSVRVK